MCKKTPQTLNWVFHFQVLTISNLPTNLIIVGVQKSLGYTIKGGDLVLLLLARQ